MRTEKYKAALLRISLGEKDAAEIARKALEKPPPLVAPGAKFGRLTVLRQGEGRRYPGGSVKCNWHCLCGCGNETLVGTSELIQGKTRSCGCLQKQMVKLRKRGWNKWRAAASADTKLSVYDD